MSFRVMVKRDRTKKIVMVDHPETGELTPWRDLTISQKKLVIRHHIRSYFDDALNEIIFSLQDPEKNPDEHEIYEITHGISTQFIKLLSGVDFTTTRNVVRGGYADLRDKSAVQQLPRPKKLKK